MEPVDGEERGESWETHLSLAAALSHRYMTEYQRDNQALAGGHANDRPDPVSSAFNRGLERGLTALFLRQFEDPTISINVNTQRILADAVVAGSIEAILPEWDALHPEEPALSFELDKEQRSKVSKRLADQLADNFTLFSDSGLLEQTYQDHQRLMPTLQDIARQRGVTPADVLRDDVLYAETIKAAFGSAEGYAREKLKEQNADFYMRRVTAVHFMGEIARARALGDMRSDEEIKSEIRQKPQWQAAVADTIRLARGVFPQITACRIRRIWGEEGLAGLPQDLRQALRS